MLIQGFQSYRVSIAREHGLLESLFSVEGNEMKSQLPGVKAIPLLGIPSFYMLVRATIV